MRFLARLGPDAEPVVSEESLDVRWWPVDDLPTDEPDMLELIGLALQRLTGQSTSSPALAVAGPGSRSVAVACATPSR